MLYMAFHWLKLISMLQVILWMHVFSVASQLDLTFIANYQTIIYVGFHWLKLISVVWAIIYMSSYNVMNPSGC